jgi:hypothetical protein
MGIGSYMVISWLSRVTLKEAEQAAKQASLYFYKKTP